MAYVQDSKPYRGCSLVKITPARIYSESDFDIDDYDLYNLPENEPSVYYFTCDTNVLLRELGVPRKNIPFTPEFEKELKHNKHEEVSSLRQKYSAPQYDAMLDETITRAIKYETSDFTEGQVDSTTDKLNACLKPVFEKVSTDGIYVDWRNKKLQNIDLAYDNYQDWSEKEIVDYLLKKENINCD